MGLGEKMKKWLLIILGLVGLDQLTKYIVSTTMVEDGASISIIKGVLEIAYTRNSGAVFGLFQGLAETYVIFLIFIGIAIALFGYMFYKTDFKDKKLIWYHLAIVLMIAGALGNGIDRIAQVDHNVVDFIASPGIWGYIFNVADVYLNIGIALFVIDQFILEPKRNKVANG